MDEQKLFIFVFQFLHAEIMKNYNSVYVSYKTHFIQLYLGLIKFYPHKSYI